MRPVLPADVDPAQHPAASALTIGHIAHELNSMLDGSMRCLTMAQRAIIEAGAVPDELDVSIVDRLHVAHDGMVRMARLLQRAMQSAQVDLCLFDDGQTLKDQVNQIVETAQPLACEHGVELEVHVSPKAAALPGGALGPVILNGLRNAIEACARNERGPRCVELSLAINTAAQLHIVISDTGPGVTETDEFAESLPHAGHGFGLDLSRRIIGALGGELRLMSVPFGSGAILEATIPLRRLTGRA